MKFFRKDSEGPEVNPPQLPSLNSSVFKILMRLLYRIDIYSSSYIGIDEEIVFYFEKFYQISESKVVEGTKMTQWNSRE